MSTVELSHHGLALVPASTAQLTTTITPKNAANQAVTWKSSDPAIATVDASGLVTALKLGGEITITVSTLDGKKTDTCLIDVTTTLPELTAYDVGPGFALGDLSDVAWASLQPGDIVNIHSKPGGYHEIIQISASGTAGKPIVIRGIPDPTTGELPVLDGNGAVMDPQVDFRGLDANGNSVFEPFGVILVTPRSTGYVYGQTFPSYITIESLDIRNALYDATSKINFTDSHGVSNRVYSPFACGIYVEFAQHLTIRGCEIGNNGNGIVVNSKNEAAQTSIDILIEGNYLHDNGQPAYPGLPGENGHGEHNIYVEAVGVVYQYNRFGPLRAGCHGSMIKDRSSGTVIRYNQVECTETAVVFYILEPQGGAGFIDQMTDYPDAYVYGNDITMLAGPSGFELVGFACQNGVDSYPTQHRGTLYFYDNTVVSHRGSGAAFSLTTTEYAGKPSISEKVDCRNNIFYTDMGLQDEYHAFHFVITDATTTVTLGTNWVSPNTAQTWLGHESPATVVGWTNLIGNGADSQNDPGFVNLVGGDYGLTSVSESRNKAAVLASGAPAVTEQYLSPRTHKPRATTGDLGAYEFN